MKNTANLVHLLETLEYIRSRHVSKHYIFFSFLAETLETFLYFLYNAKVKDTNMINVDLLIAAYMYNFRGLLEYCIKHLKSIQGFVKNLTTENVADGLLMAHITDQEGLFRAAAGFVKGKQFVKTKNWNALAKTHPTLVDNVLSHMSGLQ